jgi:REP element-mobilizing transposase RayT
MNKIFHYTFRAYKKKQVLVGEIAEDLAAVFKEICKAKGFKLIAFSALVDHVHILIEKNAADSNEYIMKMIKGISSREIFKKYPSNRFEFRKLWGRGYHAVEVKDQEALNNMINYIKGQKIEGVDKRAKPDWKPRRLVAGFHQKEQLGSRDVQSLASR